MERVNGILSNRSYRSYLEEIADRESERIYCRHDLQHLTDVARIAEILNLEAGYGIARGLVYAAALLHDCGRHLQYDNGTPHEEASADLALSILQECGYTQTETEEILRAIRLHRNREEAMKYPLADVIYRADKKSRLCMCCKAYDSCHKKPEARNEVMTH